MNTIQPQINSAAFSNLDENPFSKDRFIDQMPVTQPLAPAVNNINPPGTDLNYSKGNITDLIKNFNDINSALLPTKSVNNNINTNATNNKATLLNPTAIPSQSKPKQQEAPTYQSIIDEFDPISEENASHKPLPNLFQNNFANLTARPFQTAAAINQQQRQMSLVSPQKPNYNVNMPLANYGSNAMYHASFPVSQSFSTSNTNNHASLPVTGMGIGGAGASPYYALNYQNKVQAYRPVNFVPTGLTARFPPKSSSADFANLGQQPK